MLQQDQPGHIKKEKSSHSYTEDEPSRLNHDKALFFMHLSNCYRANHVMTTLT